MTLEHELIFCNIFVIGSAMYIAGPGVMNGLLLRRPTRRVSWTTPRLKVAGMGAPDGGPLGWDTAASS